MWLLNEKAINIGNITKIEMIFRLIISKMYRLKLYVK